MLLTAIAYLLIAALAVWALLWLLAPIGLLAWLAPSPSQTDLQESQALLSEVEALLVEAQALQARANAAHAGHLPGR